MSESGQARPVEGRLYQSPPDEAAHGASTYLPPGAPGSSLMFDQRYHPHAAAERNQDQGGGAGTSRTGIGATPPPVGSSVVHRTSGQRGTVVGHERNAHTGTAQPRVTWAGEERSWPQGVSANALRVEDSTPNRLYETDQGAADHPPLNRHTGAY